MGSGAGSTPWYYHGAPWTSPGYHNYAQSVSGLNSCTCGVYNSIIPPEPCPIHDPERAYWRRRLLAEFGGHETTTTTNSIPKYEAAEVPKSEVHFNYSHVGLLDKLSCGANPDNDDARWTRVAAWVTCETCRTRMYEDDE